MEVNKSNKNNNSLIVLKSVSALTGGAIGLKIVSGFTHEFDNHLLETIKTALRYFNKGFNFYGITIPYWFVGIGVIAIILTSFYSNQSSRR